MFKLLNKAENQYYEIPHSATISLQGSFESDRYGFHITIVGHESSLVAEDYEASAIELHTEWLTLIEGKLPEKKFQSFDGLKMLEPWSIDPTVHSLWKEALSNDEGGSTMLSCYVDQSLDMANGGALALQYLDSTRFNLSISGDIDLYVIEADTIAEYVGGSLIIYDELGQAAEEKLLIKFGRTFQVEDYSISYRQVAGKDTILTFKPR